MENKLDATRRKKKGGLRGEGKSRNRSRVSVCERIFWSRNRDPFFQDGCNERQSSATIAQATISEVKNKGTHSEGGENQYPASRSSQLIHSPYMFGRSPLTNASNVRLRTVAQLKSLSSSSTVSSDQSKSLKSFGSSPQCRSRSGVSPPAPPPPAVGPGALLSRPVTPRSFEGFVGDGPSFDSPVPSPPPPVPFNKWGAGRFGSFLSLAAKSIPRASRSPDSNRGPRSGKFREGSKGFHLCRFFPQGGQNRRQSSRDLERY